MQLALQQRFQKYAEFHQHPINRLTHKFGVPLVVFHAIAMADWIQVRFASYGEVSLGLIGYLVLIAWYLSLDLKLGLVMAFLYALCFPLGWVTPVWGVWAVAAIAWAMQFAGHVFWEKRSPALFTNFTDALVAPLFFVAILLGDWSPRESTAH